MSREEVRFSLGEQLSERDKENLRMLGHPVVQKQGRSRHKKSGTGTRVPNNKERSTMNETTQQQNPNGSQQPQGQQQQVPPDLAFQQAMAQAVNTNLNNATKLSEVLAKRAESGQPLVGMSRSEFSIRVGIVAAAAITYELSKYGFKVFFRSDNPAE